MTLWFLGCFGDIWCGFRIFKNVEPELLNLQLVVHSKVRLLVVLLKVLLIFFSRAVPPYDALLKIESMTNSSHTVEV